METFGEIAIQCIKIKKNEIEITYKKRPELVIFSYTWVFEILPTDLLDTSFVLD